MVTYDLVYDLEVDLLGDRKDPTPYCASNQLAAIGFLRLGVDSKPCIVWPDDLDGLEKFRSYIKEARYIVAHNAKFDLSWLRELGFDCDGKIICTMINQYVLNRGIRGSLSLSALADQYGTTEKLDVLSEALSKGQNFSDLDRDVGTQYLSHDVMATAEIYQKQMAQFEEEESKSLVAVRDLMCEFCSVLTDIERSGMAIDIDTLNQVDLDYQREQEELQSYLKKQTHALMGDTEVNLSSPEQMSEVVYSCKLTDKNRWKLAMNIGTDERGKPKRRPYLSLAEFRQLLGECFKRSFKTKAIQCPSCNGRGHFYKMKKNGEQFKNPTKCSGCDGKGFIYQDLKERAGLNIKPSVALASAGGFKTDKLTLQALLNQATNTEGKKFLESIIRLSAIETYRSSFIEGIKKGIKDDELLHANFNQCITATGRLSSSNPNLQNMPKGKLFPVRRAFVSRFDEGELIEIDYSQLEFRVAGILARDTTIKKEVENGFDVHAYTAQVLTAHGEPTERGPAKSSTFRPLYGGTSGTPAQMAYFREFFGKYRGVFGWHTELQEQAIRTKRVVTPTGRQFDFPDCFRNRQGNASSKTQIVNYPVQSVATAEIVPLGVILLHRKIRELGLQSLVINTVHDSVLIDTHPDEIDIIKDIGPQCLVDAQAAAEQRFGLSQFIPLAVEMSKGKNWMEQDDFT
jgi:DNA polymerase I-like protein with 3'-5' exonuclease and polymerase domains